MKLLASLVVFGLALLTAAGALWLLARAGHREREEDVMLRLRAMGAADPDAVGLARDDTVRNPLVRWTCHMLWRTGAEVEPAVVARGLLVLAALVPLAVAIFGWFAGLTIVAVLLMAVYGILASRAAQRRARILEQLPDYIEAVIRILSAGNTLEEALAAAAREQTDPLRSLFLSVGRQVRLGAAVEEVLSENAEIHQLRDLKVLALAASINRKYGGSLRSILKSLMGAIRSRDVATRELKALTAETRFSAKMLAAIPLSLTLYILARNPGYYADMWDDGTGRILLVLSVLLQLGGIVVLWRMMRSTDEGAA